jgi:Tfp pilus assembly protein PilF
MFRYIVILSLALILSIAGAQRAMSQEDIERTLTRAQALYYEAHFKDSVELLLPVDAMLRQQPAGVSLTINVKLQLALGYIGQNQTDAAKSALQEVCILDPEYKLDSTQFAPKVLALYDDVKAKQKKTRCESLCREIDRLSKSGDAEGLLNLKTDAGGGCVCGAATDAAEVLFKQGVVAYKQEKFALALEKLRGALRFNPEHDLAIEYADLAESKIDFIVERMPLDWRKHFDAREFPQATTAYRQLESLNIEGKANAALEQIRAEYRKAVVSKVASWNQSCSTRTSGALDALRQEANGLLPNPTLAADLLSGLVPCVPEVNAANAAGAASANSSPVLPAAQGCLQMTSQLAMTRIKTRVNPDIPPNRLPIGSIEMRVKVRIDEDGNVAVNGVEGSNFYINESMRVSVEKWKFLPALTDDQRRCVETEIPVVLTRS